MIFAKNRFTSVALNKITYCEKFDALRTALPQFRNKELCRIYLKCIQGKTNNNFNYKIDMKNNEKTLLKLNMFFLKKLKEEKNRRSNNVKDCKEMKRKLAELKDNKEEKETENK